MGWILFASRRSAGGSNNKMQGSGGALLVPGSTGTTPYVPHSGTAIKSLHLLQFNDLLIF
jgi:hypothetical protein